MPLPLQSREVTIEQVDGALAALAQRCRFSSPAVRSHGAPQMKSCPDDLLKPIYHRLQSREAKWLTRLLLKNYSSVLLPESYIMHRYHFLLPELLQFQSTFDAAANLLRGPVVGGFPASPKGTKDEERYRLLASAELVPQMGVKVGRANFVKARVRSSKRKNGTRLDDTKSIKHCLQMAASRNMSLERKYDGEYCQIHVDLVKGAERIQIFSKSGKDSTLDRRGVHGSIVYKDYEHRRACLQDVVYEIEGHSEVAWRERINFSTTPAANQLRKAFATGIASRWEGFVLKPCDQPYFGLVNAQQAPSRSWIKLKKDYIAGLGDCADFAVVGASYNAADVTGIKVPGLKWTHFYIACLENKNKVARFGDKPFFKVVDAMKCIPKHDLIVLNQLGLFRAVPFDSCQEYEALHVSFGPGACDEMDVLFKEPFVMEVVGGGFDKQPNQSFFTLRWPRATKIHFDRSYGDVVSFDELQELAREARSAPLQSADREEREWFRRLGRIYKRNNPDVSESIDDDQECCTETTSRTDVDSTTESHISRTSPPPFLIRTDTVELATAEPQQPPPAQLEGDNSAAMNSQGSLPTPPPSSPVRTVRNGDRERLTSPIDLFVPNNKRNFDNLSEQPTTPLPIKKGKRSSPLWSFGLGTTVSPPEVEVQTHQPLANVTNGSPTRKRGSPRAHISGRQGQAGAYHQAALAEAVEAAGFLLTPPEVAPARISSHRPIEPPQATSAPSTRATNRDSRPTFAACHLSTSCALSNTLVLLSPCVAHMPYITDDLLPAHGVPHTATPTHLTSPHLSSFTKKMLLVESHRTRPTADFMRVVAAHVQTANEVEIYDWRVLESLAKEERGERLDHVPLRKWFITRL
ncbi:MAG: hypothetical protein M1833_004656 [Piccolia ochrophora]|nr:MAG: hypothetical protein M1833_004656 [Piccolia ochrophora]